MFKTEILSFKFRKYLICEAILKDELAHYAHETWNYLISKLNVEFTIIDTIAPNSPLLVF